MSLKQIVNNNLRRIALAGSIFASTLPAFSQEQSQPVINIFGERTEYMNFDVSDPANTEVYRDLGTHKTAVDKENETLELGFGNIDKSELHHYFNSIANLQNDPTKSLDTVTYDFGNLQAIYMISEGPYDESNLHQKYRFVFSLDATNEFEASLRNYVKNTEALSRPITSWIVGDIYDGASDTTSLDLEQYTNGMFDDVASEERSLDKNQLIGFRNPVITKFDLSEFLGTEESQVQGNQDAIQNYIDKKLCEDLSCLLISKPYAAVIDRQRSKGQTNNVEGENVNVKIYNTASLSVTDEYFNFRSDEDIPNAFLQAMSGVEYNKGKVVEEKAKKEKVKKERTPSEKSPFGDIYAGVNFADLVRTNNLPTDSSSTSESNYNFSIGGRFGYDLGTVGPFIFASYNVGDQKTSIVTDNEVLDGFELRRSGRETFAEQDIATITKYLGNAGLGLNVDLNDDLSVLVQGGASFNKAYQTSNGVILLRDYAYDGRYLDEIEPTQNALDFVGLSPKELEKATYSIAPNAAIGVTYKNIGLNAGVNNIGEDNSNVVVGVHCRFK